MVEPPEAAGAAGALRWPAHYGDQQDYGSQHHYGDQGFVTADASFDVISYHRELRTVGKVLKLHAHIQEILL